MQTSEIYEKLKGKFGEAIVEMIQPEKGDPFITVAPEKIVEISLFLRDDEETLFDYMVILSGMDYGDEKLGVVYHLYSIKRGHYLAVKAILDRENPEIPTVEKVWKSANWHEREAYDMFGIKFTGHPNLIRILSPYDWEGYPLRKDYKTPEEYHGIKVPY